MFTLYEHYVQYFSGQVMLTFWGAETQHFSKRVKDVSFQIFYPGYLLTTEFIRLFVQFAYNTQFAICKRGPVGPEDIFLCKQLTRN